ncbi:response regulator [Patulibacter sp.]|uniref:response regulator n=1 Tax=Patulibacter sp. TaxID=1912859 RepID=UPI0027178646|nr:response regulator [Patulibacter sp.]MDO9410244.1 response regulator [Patulibacter sp.]
MLVVDDDFRVAALHAEVVGTVPGLRVVAQVHGAAAALDAVQKHRPELVLLDRYLPDADGIDLLRRLRGARDGAPDVLMLTAARDLASVRSAVRAGALHYLLKPVDFAVLRARLQAWSRLQAGVRRDAALEVDQREIDRLFALRSGAPERPAPEGDGPPTARRILEALRAAGGERTATDVAEAVGVSRATAQRHLAALTRTGTVALDLRYGATGRPEHLYRVAEGAPEPTL